MKNKNKISEDLTMGNTSMTTATYPTSPLSKANKPGANTYNLKKRDLGDPTVQKSLAVAKNTTINIVDETLEGSPHERLQYLSNVKDSKSGKISQPFTIADKRYQMVRALKSDGQKIVAVLCLDDMDESGKNIIHSVEDFEENIAKKEMNGQEGKIKPEENPADTQAPGQTQSAPSGGAVAMEEEKETHPSFAGYKHFIVNRKANKARKFKNIAELASANMSEGEEYMGMKDFKKFVDEVLFGGAKKQVREQDPNATLQNVSQQNVQTAQPNNGSQQVELQLKAEKLMVLIKKAIPGNVLKTIQTPVAQKEIIAAFGELIGVPRKNLGVLLTGIQNEPPPPPVSEGIKRPIIKIVKVKDIK